ncbi:MAG: phosphatidylglycerophosphatase A [Candidatus Acidiferrales bacterium]
MTPETDTPPVAPEPRKPRLSYLIATALGLGYLRPGPGTWGSLAGLALAGLFAIRNDWMVFGRWRFSSEMAGHLLVVLVSFAGVWAAGRVAKHCGKTDPQFVVIDEVSGQWLTLMIGSAHAFVSHSSTGTVWFAADVSFFGTVPLNWKYLMLGFILFRGFDIWKPFPVRQAESLPGGWGIMADDWLAAIYAAAGLWIARWLGL